MKRVFLLLFVQFLFVGLLFSQTEDLYVKKNAKGSYVEHKLAPKENFYSIGRLFGVHPKHIASFNGLDMRKGLSIGQVIMIPLSDTNFAKRSDKGFPVYSDDKSIAGYLIAGEIAETSKPISPKEETMVSKTDTSMKIVPTDLFQNKNKGKEKDTTTELNKEEKMPVKTEEPKKVQPKTEQANSLSAGYFQSYFQQQVKKYPLSRNETITSGIFKVTSGGKEAKYYALIDGVEPGTIIRVINPTNNRAVYAKVLGEMKGFRQNEGLDLRISEAAASALEISDPDKFIVTVNY